MGGTRFICLLLLAAMLAPSPASADPVPVAPPENLEASPLGDNTFLLTWSPPAASTADYTYHIHLNGIPVATTADTSYTILINGSAVFFITASLDGFVSAPSEPTSVQGGDDDIIFDSDDYTRWGVAPYPYCSPAGLSIKEAFPYVYVGGPKFDCILPLPIPGAPFSGPILEWNGPDIVVGGEKIVG